MKIGILGGTFDPIHLGHLRSAEEIGRKLGLEKVYLVPSSSPPHKINRSVASFDHRFAMVRLAVGDSDMLEAMDLEGKRPGLSYSIETLREFHDMLRPTPELFFILGMDAFLEIKSWKEYAKLFDHAHFVIIQRAGHPPERIEPFILSLLSGVKKTRDPDLFVTPSGTSIMLVAPTLMDISSTRIREMVMNGKSIRFLVPESVRHFIMKKGLYGSHATY